MTHKIKPQAGFGPWGDALQPVLTPLGLCLPGRPPPGSSARCVDPRPHSASLPGWYFNTMPLSQAFPSPAEGLGRGGLLHGQEVQRREARAELMSFATNTLTGHLHSEQGGREWQGHCRARRYTVMSLGMSRNQGAGCPWPLR